MYDAGNGETDGTSKRPTATNQNVIANMKEDIRETVYNNLTSRSYLEISFLKNFKFTANYSYDFTNSSQTVFYTPLIGDGQSFGGRGTKGSYNTTTTNFNQILAYSNVFGDNHHLSAKIGHEYYKYEYQYLAGQKTNFFNPNNPELDNGGQMQYINSYTANHNIEGYFGMADYDYSNKYYLSAAFRRDGTSRFLDRWGNFWSVSGMWHLGAEDFMKAVKPVLSDVKIRASYGVNGNQPGSYYGYMGLYSYGKNYMDNPGSYESTQANPNLKWEKNYNMNLGLDLAFIDRIFVTLEYYNRDTKDLLYNRPISATTGFLNYLGNLGQLNNKGVELEVRSLNISNADFNWTTVLNLTHNKNKIVALDGNLDQVVESSWFIRKIGLPFNTFYVKEFAGVDPSSGNALYYKNTEDENGNLDRTLTQDVNEAQAVPYKQVDPKISGGLTNILSYKWFDLAFTLSYSLGGYSFDKTGTYIETDGASEGNRNLPIYELDRWQKPGDITDIPRFVLGRSDKVSGGSSRFVHSTDHLRLKNLTFGFTLPHNWTDKVLLDKVRVYFSGSNLLTWAKWKQYDPEVPVSGEVFCETPPMRTFSFGVEVNF